MFNKTEVRLLEDMLGNMKEDRDMVAELLIRHAQDKVQPQLAKLFNGYTTLCAQILTTIAAGHKEVMSYDEYEANANSGNDVFWLTKDENAEMQSMMAYLNYVLGKQND